MKKNLALAVIGIAALVANVANAEILEPLDVFFSGCIGSAFVPSEDDDSDKKGMHLKLEYNDGKLVVNILNITENCCITEMVPVLSREGNDLYLEPVYDDDLLCYCMCLFDLTGTYEGIEPGTYTLHFSHWQEYSWKVDVGEGLDQCLMPGVAERPRTLLGEEISLAVKDGIVEAEGNGEITIEIIDSNGVRLITSLGLHKAEANVSMLGSGWYVARAMIGDHNLTTRPFLR